MKFKRALALSMAAVTALTSTSIVAFAEGKDSKALANAIKTVKTRIDVPDELSEFNYKAINRNLSDSFNLSWTTPDNSENYGCITATIVGKVIVNYWRYDDNIYNTSKSSVKLSLLTGDEIYEKAKKQLKKLNPVVADSIKIDRDSLYISKYDNTAQFNLVRTKNGIPVQNDAGRITVDKNTGELLNFSITWHEKASFKKADKIISEDKALQSYAKMIDIEPQYEIYYDWEQRKTLCRLVFVQSDFGEINAFNGKKSNFAADGYFDEFDETLEAEDNALTEGGADNGFKFTEQEQAELDRKLPYANEAAIKELLKNNKYLTYRTDMELSYSRLYKMTYDESGRYLYSATFTNENWSEEEEPIVEDFHEFDDVDEKMSVVAAAEEFTGGIEDYQTVNITVDAESGEIISYSLYDSKDYGYADSYDLNKADKLAKEIAGSFAGDKFGEYRDNSSEINSWIEYDANKNKLTRYSGSYHTFTRYANDIRVSGNGISLSLNSDMKLIDYRISYTVCDIPKPDGMLTEKQAMDKFWEKNTLDLYYLARLNEKKTKTVLVYGCDNTVYIDAFTGEPVYSRYAKPKNDLSGIKDKEIKKMAQRLSDNGYIISTEKFSENDPASAAAFANLMRTNVSENADEKLTRGEALIIFTRGACGDEIAQLKGIYKSPFSDVKDDDENVGYYAIAYAMGAVKGGKLNPKSDFTWGDLIKMVYTVYSEE